MDIGDNFSDSFDYAKKLFSDGSRLLILIILGIIPVVNWIVVGYASRVLSEAPGAKSPPALEKYGDLFVDGAKVFFASLIYMIIPLILIGLGVASVFSAMFMGGLLTGTFNPMAAGGMVLLGGTGLVLLLVGAVLAFLALIVLGAAIAHMIEEKKFGKAFAFGEILGVIRGIGWGKYLAWVVLVVIITIIVGAIVGAIPFVGWLIEVIIAPAVAVFFSGPLAFSTLAKGNSENLLERSGQV